MLDYFTFTCESKKVLHRYRVGIILYIRKKRERERAGARQRRFVAGCRAGESV
jgi:hypothetical protein